MSRYSVIFLALVGVLAATGAAGQGRSIATAQFSARVPAIVALTTQSTGATPVAVGLYTELRGATVLRVKANCRWELLALASDGQAAPVSIRVRASDRRAMSLKAGFAPVVGGQAVATGGLGGEIELIVDYRTPAGAPLRPISYQVQAIGG